MKPLFIYDWDDTLFPTSWIIKNNYSIKNPTHKLKLYLNYLDKLIVNLLTNTNKIGEVVIVTNASIKWIQDCIDSMPNCKTIITSYFPVLSARDKYSRLYPTKIEFWKKNTFSELTFKRQHDQVISIGDNESEYLALVHIMKQNYCKTIKSIKFKSFPDNIMLINQLMLLSKSIPKVINFKGHIDLVIN